LRTPKDVFLVRVLELSNVDFLLRTGEPELLKFEAELLRFPSLTGFADFGVTTVLLGYRVGADVADIVLFKNGFNVLLDLFSNYLISSSFYAPIDPTLLLMSNFFFCSIS